MPDEKPKKEVPASRLPNHHHAKVFALEKCGFPLLYEERTDTYWRHDRGAWSPISMERLIYAREKKDGFDGIRRYMVKADWGNRTSDATYKDVAKQLKGECDICDIVIPEWIAFEDCSLNPKTMATAGHDKERIAVVRINAKLSEIKGAKGEAFDRYLASICVHEDLTPSEEMRLQLQEIAGYALLPDTKRALAFFLSGRGRNGKGVFMSVIRAMLGHEKTTSMTLTELTSGHFAKSQLIGMLANFSEETKTTKESMSDVFKTLVANDVITADVKFGHSVTYRPFCKYFFNVNGVPQFDCVELAVRERVMFVPFFRSFTEEERDWDLTERITGQEMPYVVSWALEGLKRLKANNMIFTKSTESAETLREFERASSSVIEYFDAEWEPSEKPTPFTEFYDGYKDYVGDKGRSRVSSIRCAKELAERCGKSVRFHHNPSKKTVVGVLCRRKQSHEQGTML